MPIEDTRRPKRSEKRSRPGQHRTKGELSQQAELRRRPATRVAADQRGHRLAILDNAPRRAAPALRRTHRGEARVPNEAPECPWPARADRVPAGIVHERV